MLKTDDPLAKFTTKITSGIVECIAYSGSTLKANMTYRGFSGIDSSDSSKTGIIEAGYLWITGAGAIHFGCSSFTVTGTKSRLVETKDYNDRLLYCYETPTPMFGDIGEGQTDDTGVCEVWLDDIFAETIDTEVKYQVFLQMYSEGSLKVTERNSMYFKVEGTPNASFGWELKAVQRDYDTMRLEEPVENQEEDTTIGETYSYLESLLYDVEGEQL